MNQNAIKLNLLTAGATFLLAAACVGMSADKEQRASAQLQPTQGNDARGSVSFEQSDGRLIVTADIAGLKPDSVHGFHVHEKGDCSAADAESAGGHFNPKGAPHGGHPDANRHAGDLPNLRADANGHAQYRAESKIIALNGATSVVGRSVILHADPDNYQSQPSGNAGARIACGVIRPAS